MFNERMEAMVAQKDRDLAEAERMRKKARQRFRRSIHDLLDDARDDSDAELNRLLNYLYWNVRDIDVTYIRCAVALDSRDFYKAIEPKDSGRKCRDCDAIIYANSRADIDCLSDNRWSLDVLCPACTATHYKTPRYRHYGRHGNERRWTFV